MGSVIDAPPTTSRCSLTHDKDLSFLSSVTNFCLCSSVTSARNLKRTVKGQKRSNKRSKIHTNVYDSHVCRFAGLDSVDPVPRKQRHIQHIYQIPPRTEFPFGFLLTEKPRRPSPNQHLESFDHIYSLRRPIQSNEPSSHLLESRVRQSHQHQHGRIGKYHQNLCHLQ